MKKNHKERYSKHTHVVHEESESNWLVSYADLMTLLFGFFVLLFSFSKIDDEKFEQLKREATKTFGGEYQKPFENITASMKEIVQNQKLQDQVAFQETDAGVEVTFRGALFFESGASDLRQEAKDMLEQMVPTIIGNAKGFGIVIEGHTDNRPMYSNGPIATNWELSSVRACTVLRFFLDKGFNPDAIKAMGFGDRRPVVPNEDKDGNPLPDNQAQNRRVVIRILRSFE